MIECHSYLIHFAVLCEKIIFVKPEQDIYSLVRMSLDLIWQCYRNPRTLRQTAALMESIHKTKVYCDDPKQSQLTNEASPSYIFNHHFNIHIKQS